MKTSGKIILCAIAAALVLFSGCSQKNTTKDGALLRGKATPELEAAFSAYINEIDSTGEDIHSVMILKNGKVVEEKFFGDWTPDKPHTMWSVSKSFTATAVGLAISDGLLTTDTKVLSIFPEYTNISEDSLQNERLSEMTVRDLLTMSCGHDADPTGAVRGQYIIVIPDKQAVVALTSNTKLGMQSELDAIWKHLLPAL